jgi:hypothetical protein
VGRNHLECLIAEARLHGLFNDGVKRPDYGSLRGPKPRMTTLARTNSNLLDWNGQTRLYSDKLRQEILKYTFKEYLWNGFN